MSSAKVSYCKSLIQNLITQEVTPAFIGLVARRGVIVFNEAFGSQGPEPNSPAVSTDTLFPLASITKPFTATALMTLVEDGLVSLNRPVSWYIPEFMGEYKEQVLVHHLLTHTSGLTDKTVGEHLDSKPKSIEVPPPEETQHPEIHKMLYRAYDVPLTKRPGEVMRYCNFGMQLVGEIIRRVSRQPLQQFFHQRIFAPLGMDSTYLVVPQEARSRAIRFPEDSEHGRWMCNERHFETPHAAGGAYSTVGDMAIFAQTFLNKGIYGTERILSPVTVAQMTRNQIPGIPATYEGEVFKEASWGLGWNIFGNKIDYESGPLKSTQAYGHGGSGRSILWIDPEYEVVGMIFYVKMPPVYRKPDDVFRNAIMSAIIEE